MFTSIDLLYNLSYPIIAFHGSLSLTVNFVALQEYFSINQDHCFHCTVPQSSPLDIAICCYRLESSSLSYLFQTFHSGFNFLHIYDLFVLRDHIEDCTSTSTSTSIPLDVIYYLLKLCAWDYDILLQFEFYLRKYLTDISLDLRETETSSFLIFQLILQNSSKILLTCLDPADRDHISSLLSYMESQIQIRLCS